MDFEEMERKNNGAEYMTLIKGDIDNLGLIMSYGLVDDNFNYTAISRTTTLSNHLKYFFSFSLNGFLEDWENGNVKKAVDDKFIHDQKVYTVFAGGDDLMLICPQSSSLKLLDAFNKTFTDFVCNNPEVHISYSLTNFKHNTPIRIVSEISEDNQKEIKRKMMNPNILSEIDTNLNVFHYFNDKASTRIFETNLKNDVISEVVSNSEQLAKWEEDENNPVTQGIIRNLFYFAKILKDFEEKNDTRLIIWHPKLTYMINRLLKDKNGNYKNTEIKDFFDLSLKINKDNTEAKKLASILFPLTCQTIYRTRKKKEKK
jgi:CRISPR-associated protein Csm1